MEQCKISKSIVISIMICLLSFFGNSLSYSEEHWAQAEMDYLVSKGIVLGYPDGTLKPDNTITRAEFVKIINKVIGSHEEVDLSFKDVNDKDWFYNEIAKAVKSGYVEGYEDNTFRPNKPITRQEVAKIVVTVFGLEGDSLNNSRFVDQSKISNWAREYVSILQGKGYISGYVDGTFRPNAPITRAESMKIITNVSGEIINVKGEYSKDTIKNVLVNISDVVLKDMRIEGDLFLLEGIGDGDVILDNIIVDGTIYITGGGPNSILIKNSKVGKIAINKANRPVYIIFDNSETSLVVINENTNFTAKNGTSIEVMEIAGKSNIRIEKESKVAKMKIKSQNVEIVAEGDILSIVSNEDFKLNGQRIKKGTELSVKDGKIVGPKKEDGGKETRSRKDYEEDDERDNEDDKPIPTYYEFIVDLDKDQYGIEETITLSGSVSRNDIGLANVDITLKLGDEPITIEQLKTNKNGEFTCTFMVPDGTVPGDYKLTVKANEPVNIVKTLDIKLFRMNEKYKINIKLDKEKYTLDEIITINGEILEENIGLPNVDITLQLQDDVKEVITIGQLKTNGIGGFSHDFMVPEDTKFGKYNLIFKINQPLNRFLEFSIEIIDG